MANCISSFKALLKSPFPEIHPDHLSQTPAFTFSIIPLLYSSVFCQDTYSFLHIVQCISYTFCLLYNDSTGSAIITSSCQ